MKNARIWTFVNDGFVKLTIEPDKPLRWHKYTRHDEGWSTESSVWDWDGFTLKEAWCHDGTDCDGRLTRGGVLSTKPDQFNSRMMYVDANAPDPNYPALSITAEGAEIIYLPEWESIEEGQRDYTAEAMGY